MKRHTQQTGIRRWYGQDLLDLQAESLKIMDDFFGQFGSFILSGCEVTAATGDKFNVAPGLVILSGKDESDNPTRLVARFDGTTEAQILPLFLYLTHETLSDIYNSGEEKPIAYDFKATATNIRPEKDYIEVKQSGTPRFTDAIQDSSHRFVKDSEKTVWNAKANTTTATPSAAGLMSAADKSKLDGVAVSANNYIHPNDANTRHVSDTEKATWNAKANTTAATSSAAGLMSAADKSKLDGVAVNANKYTHPDDANTRHVTDAEKVAWNAKANTATATSSAAGLMSSADKSKLDSLAESANYYVHPNDANTRHVTDAEKATWNAKANTAAATSATAGLMSAADKSKLDGVATGANNYIHPSDSNTRHVTDSEKATWNAKETTAGAQAKANQALADAKTYTTNYTQTVPRFNKSIYAGNDNNNITTAEFIEMLDKDYSAFDGSGYWISRGANWYAKNRVITDTGIGNIHLASAVIEVIASFITNFTIRITTPVAGNGSGELKSVFIYTKDDTGAGWFKLHNSCVSEADKLKWNTSSYKSGYTGILSANKGVLVETDIPITADAMVYGEIRGHTNSDTITIFTTFQFYNYATSNSIIGETACNYGFVLGSMSAFGYNGKVCIWFPDSNSYQSYSIFIRQGGVNNDTNRVASITVAAKPTATIRETAIKMRYALLNITNAGGALSGTFSDLSIKNNAVTAAKLSQQASWMIGVNAWSANNAQNRNLVDLMQYDPQNGRYTTPVVCLGDSWNSYTINMSMYGEDSIYPHLGYILINNIASVSKTVIFSGNPIGINNITKVVSAGKMLVVQFMPMAGGSFVITSMFLYENS